MTRSMTNSSSGSSFRAATPPLSRDLIPDAVDEAGMPVRIMTRAQFLVGSTTVANARSQKVTP